MSAPATQAEMTEAGTRLGQALLHCGNVMTAAEYQRVQELAVEHANAIGARSPLFRCRAMAAYLEGAASHAEAR